MVLIQQKIFNKDECEKIINTIKSKKEKSESNDRRYESKSIEYNDNTKWIFEKLKHFFEKETNDTIISLKEKIHFHQFVKGDFFGKHNDSMNRSVYGVGCLLNDDYEGGDFIFYKNPEVVIQKQVGNSYIFNVNIEHEVKEITYGNRFSLLWFLEDVNLKVKNNTFL
jgi:predicted 2-oxoglutarate/Fe(II)-dependent dioxygenase YbiX